MKARRSLGDSLDDGLLETLYYIFTVGLFVFYGGLGEDEPSHLSGAFFGEFLLVHEVDEVLPGDEVGELVEELAAFFVDQFEGVDLWLCGFVVGDGDSLEGVEDDWSLDVGDHVVDFGGDVVGVVLR